MAIDRRDLMAGALALVALPSRGQAAPASPGYVTACQRADGRFAVLLLDADGRVTADWPLSARAHDIAWNAATGFAVAFSRQPGRFAVAFRPGRKQKPSLFAPPRNRCFFGHGQFSPDGRLLYTTENDLDTGTGLVGIYDVSRSFARIGEFSSGGVGPHELILLPDGRTLAVANGGYETLPATGRQSIDVVGMRPSLAFVDPVTGDTKSCHELATALRPLSIRHLAVDLRGRVWFGGQWEGDPEATPEVIGHAAPDRALTLLRPPVPLGRSLKGYVGSVAASLDGSLVAVSAPRAGRTLILDADSGAVQAEVPLSDGCGLAADDGGFVISSGNGSLLRHRGRGSTSALAGAPGIAFDNHMRWLGPPDVPRKT